MPPVESWAPLVYALVFFKTKYYSRRNMFQKKNILAKMPHKFNGKKVSFLERLEKEKKMA
jgi:hypothetical protein